MNPINSSAQFTTFCYKISLVVDCDIQVGSFIIPME